MVEIVLLSLLIAGLLTLIVGTIGFFATLEAVRRLL